MSVASRKAAPSLSSSEVVIASHATPARARTLPLAICKAAQRAAREASGMSQADQAALLGISQQIVARQEHPGFTQVMNLAQLVMQPAPTFELTIRELCAVREQLHGEQPRRLVNVDDEQRAESFTVQVQQVVEVVGQLASLAQRLQQRRRRT